MRSQVDHYFKGGLNLGRGGPWGLNKPSGLKERLRMGQEAVAVAVTVWLGEMFLLWTLPWDMSW